MDTNLSVQEHSVDVSGIQMQRVRVFKFEKGRFNKSSSDNISFSWGDIYCSVFINATGVHMHHACSQIVKCSAQ